ncbi:MAG: glucose-1-phosphate adenylyltransferase [Thermodesulfovibrionales bacterium]|nr:glucose-1-phosphate adenylyltransferase [Thermodesulfovibrionales bacterium]
MSYPKTLAFILAGGKGERLFPLTAFRSKPSVPFGGRYRIIDFVLSNMINSQIYSIYLLVQYKSQSLIEHVRRNWVLSSVIRDHFVTVVPPQMRMGPEWFQGTADAVFQNRVIISELNPDLVLIFGADHIYKMNIRQMIDFHLSVEADVTVSARPVPISQASSFGVIVADADRRIRGFEEKPQNPTPMSDNPDMAYVSMGNYIFRRQTLLDALFNAQRLKQHDFGAHVIPSLVNSGARVFAYDFGTNIIPGSLPTEEKGYWRDVGTIKAFVDAHKDLLGQYPLFNLNNKQWPIHNAGAHLASTRIVSADVSNSIIADGATIVGAKITNSILRSNVTIEDDTEIQDCIIMDNVTIKKGCRLINVIIDKFNIIGEGVCIGLDPEKDRFHCHIDSCGVAIIPRGGTVGKVSK